MAHISMFNKTLFVLIISLFIVSECLAQNKVDLELTVQSAAKSVRGKSAITKGRFNVLIRLA